MYTAFLHSHVASWALLFILFVVASIFLLMNISKGLKIAHMILRLSYILVFITGIGLLNELGYPWIYIFKGVMAFIMIGFMEMLLSRGAKGMLSSQKASIYSVLILVIAVITLLIGYKII